MVKQNTIVLVTAILSLTGLEIFAMSKGIDGYLFSLIAVAIAGIAGFKFPAIKEYFTRRKK
mgnify:CR=1 FL=1